MPDISRLLAGIVITNYECFAVHHRQADGKQNIDIYAELLQQDFRNRQFLIPEFTQRMILQTFTPMSSLPCSSQVVGVLGGARPNYMKTRKNPRSSKMRPDRSTLSAGIVIPNYECFAVPPTEADGKQIIEIYAEVLSGTTHCPHPSPSTLRRPQ